MNVNPTELTRVIKAARRAGVTFEGARDMPTEELASLKNMSPERARLLKEAVTPPARRRQRP